MVNFPGVPTPPRTPNCTWDKRNLFTNTSLCSSFSQYAIFLNHWLMQIHFYFCDRPWDSDESVWALHEKCPYSKLFRSAFSRICNEYGEMRSISPHSVKIRENADQNNSEYGHLLRSGRLNYISYLGSLCFCLIFILQYIFSIYINFPRFLVKTSCEKT